MVVVVVASVFNLQSVCVFLCWETSTSRIHERGGARRRPRRKKKKFCSAGSFLLQLFLFFSCVETSLRKSSRSVSSRVQSAVVETVKSEGLP